MTVSTVEQSLSLLHFTPDSSCYNTSYNRKHINVSGKSTLADWNTDDNTAYGGGHYFHGGSPAKLLALPSRK